MTSLTSFPRFSKLPPELRIKIWDLNLPGPRCVSLHPQSSPRRPSTRSNPRPPSPEELLLPTTSFPPTTATTTRAAPIPTNLHVSKEARQHAMKRYRLSFHLLHRAPKVWFDMERDVLYFGDVEGWLGGWNSFVSTLCMVPSSELKRVRRLAVVEGVLLGRRGSRDGGNVQATHIKEFWQYVRRKLGGVREVIVLSTGEEAEGDGETGCGETVVARVPVSRKGADGEEDDTLVGKLERGLLFVYEEKEWLVPKWMVLKTPKMREQTTVGHG